MLQFNEKVQEDTGMRIIDLLPKKVKRMIYRHQHQDKYKAALLMVKALRRDPDVISRGLSMNRIKGIAADHFGLNHREFDRVLDRKTRYEEKSRDPEEDEGYVEEYIVEAPLGPADLAGVNNDTGELRVNILKDLIKKGTPIKMVPGKGHKNDLFTVTDKKAALNALDQFTRDGKSFSLGTNDGKNVLSSHIFKSKLFGGETGGAGPGTKATAETEAAQALWCAAVTAEGKKTYEYFTNEILSKHTNRAFTGGTNLKTMLGIPEDWRKSSYLSAVVLLDGGFINKSQTFHRDDLKMNDIYSKKKDAYRNNEMKNLNNDKWNPGDIWALDKSFNAENIPVLTVHALNVYMLEEYIARRIVGISLKIVDKGDGNFKEYNKEVPVPTDDYKVDKMFVKGAKRGSFWSTKRGSITSKEGMNLQIAANKSFGTMKIEITGKGARGGGIGYGPIEDTLELLKMPKIESNNNLVKMAKAIADPAKKNNKVRRDFYNRVSNFDKMTLKVFNDELAKKDAVWVHSKLGVITILEAFNNASKIKANRLITRIINYAGSKSEDASVYVKVSN
tara:strand:+ start:69 stop:1751 length:1683 start_codon:yes stop_codon:yes gene_type:complete